MFFWQRFKTPDILELYDRVLDVAMTYTDYVDVNLVKRITKYVFLALLNCKFKGVEMIKRQKQVELREIANYFWTQRGKTNLDLNENIFFRNLIKLIYGISDRPFSDLHAQ